MKIYFLAAVSGLDQYQNNYQKIVKTMENAGHKVLADHILTNPKKVQNLTHEERHNYFRKMQSRVKTSDAVVVETSYPTANLGFEVAYAQENEKPILVLRDETSSVKIPALFEGNTSDKFLVYNYNDKTLEDTLVNGLEELKSMLDVRYNFFISKEIVDYLNFIAKSRRTPRSVYLRNLVEEAMSNDETYQKMLKENFEQKLLED